MNILDTLLLMFAAVTCILLSRDYFIGEETQIFIILLVPSTVFGLLIIFKDCNKLKNGLFKKWKYCYKYCSICNEVDSEENNETQILINPVRNYFRYIW